MKLCWLMLLLSSHAFAADPQAQLGEAKALFERGAYPQSLNVANSIDSSDKAIQAAKALHLAETHAKMQAFDQAAPLFKRAIELGAESPSLFYDYGQALFATRNLKEAEAQFKKSIVKQFKMAASAYYVAYIRQLQENYAGAKDYYQRIQRLNADPDKVKQAALFQTAEMEYDQIATETNRNKRAAAYHSTALPLYRKARDFEKGTPIEAEAVKKITELEDEVAAVFSRMVNGNPIPRKAYTLKLSQELGYDSNVITEADGALVQVSDKDSFFSKSSLLGRYQFNFRRRFSVVPELNMVLTKYLRRDAPLVYQNDSLSVTPAVRSKWEHFSRGKPATGLFDLEYNQMQRDYAQRKDMMYYTRYWNFSFGERVNWFKFGSTTARISIKFGENYNPARTAITPSLSLQQNVKVLDNYDLQNTFTADYMRARDRVNDERNYKFRHGLSMPNQFWKVDVNPSISFTFKDTVNQKYLRGTELLINPAVGLTREFGSFDGNFDYSFSKNYSKSKDQYQYTKHEISAGLGYRF